MFLESHPESSVIRLQLRQNAVIKGLSEAEIGELEPYLEIVECHKHDTLVPQGVHEEMGQYFVLEGVLKRVVSNKAAKEMILRFAQEREIETSYAASRLGTPMPYSIVSVTKARVAKLPLKE